MTLRLYNTLTREKTPFEPIDRNNVRMYVCGPTVYDYAHIGNARPAIVFDVLFRLLRHLYGESHVTYARNITDVDDKINARALRDHEKEIASGQLDLNSAIRRVTESTYDQYQKDVAALGCLPPTVQPRATDNIAQMIEMIQKLLDKGIAYVAQGTEGREALFDVRLMPDYGALSRRDFDDQQAGARVAVEAHKRNPEDFVLWKESRNSEPGWPAEFSLTDGNRSELRANSTKVTIFGRPGWHIECSAMSKRYLGEVFDIHGGGLDLIFPHHENEIAQSRCAFGTTAMAKVWMHNGFLQVEGQKMSKSLGNFVTIHELLRDWPGEVLRLNMLRTHYRQPIDWTLRGLEESAKTLRNWSTWALSQESEAQLGILQGSWPMPSRDLLASLMDDINTPAAIATMHDSASSANSDEQSARKLFQDAAFLGLLSPDKLWVHQSGVVGTGVPILDFFDDVALLRVAIANNDRTAIEARRQSIRHRGAEPEIGADGFVSLSPLRNFDKAKIQELITQRLEARKAKNWAESDRIRDELAKMGIAIKDNKDGTTSWEVKR